MHLPKECGSLSGKIVRLNQSLHGLKTDLACMARTPHFALEYAKRSEQVVVDACEFRLIEEISVTIIAVIRVDNFLSLD